MDVSFGNTNHLTAVVETSEIWMDVFLFTWDESNGLEVVVFLDHVLSTDDGSLGHGS